MSVSLSVCVCVPYLLRNDWVFLVEIFRDDSPWNANSFRLKNMQIRQAVRRRKLSIPKSHLADILISQLLLR